MASPAPNAPGTDLARLRTLRMETSKKGGLTYTSWADAWAAALSVDPTATFEWHETEGPSGPRLGLWDDSGVTAKVTVTMLGITRTMHLPVMNNRNQAILAEKVTSTALNKAYARCLVKCLALFGLGLYVYRGEDLPTESAPEPPPDYRATIEAMTKHLLANPNAETATKCRARIADWPEPHRTHAAEAIADMERAWIGTPTQNAEAGASDA